MRIHHVVEDGQGTTLCGKNVSDIEAHGMAWHVMSQITNHDSDVHFNCVECHKVLTGNQKHSQEE